MGHDAVVMGNHASAIGAKLARVQVISAYPITPQTQIVEELSEMVARGEVKAHDGQVAKFIKVESEHSAMACCIGAAQAGARAFTATSAQGLALMHELLFWSAYSRLPMVMVDVNRAMAPGWSIWSDQTDSLAQRDTGWIQLYCETNQEVLDTMLMAYKLTEAVKIPVMVIYDAFILSHTSEPVNIPDAAEADKFLPPFNPELRLEPGSPMAFGPLTSPEHYMEFRYIMEEAHQDAVNVYNEIAKDFYKQFGRKHDIMELYKADDAETVLVTSGSMTSTARLAVDELRGKGQKVGLCKLKMFRPFPKEILKQAFGNLDGNAPARKLLVLDKNISHGSGGIWAQEIKSTFYDLPHPPPIDAAFIGLGGRDVTPAAIIKAYEETKGRVTGKPVWVDLKA